MCYIVNDPQHELPPTRPGTQDERIGVRELRQHASAYLRRVRTGERFTITDRGVPVASLGPVLSKPTSILERLVADGAATPPPPRRPDEPRFPPPIPSKPGERPLTEILLEMREEERY